MKLLKSLSLVLVFASLALAQVDPDPAKNVASNSEQFSFSANVASLGTKAGSVLANFNVVSFAVNRSISLRQDTLISAASRGLFGGLQYKLPTEKLLAKSNFDPSTFGFYVAASGGEVFTAGLKHPGFLFHAVAAYDPTHKGKFSVVLLDAGVARLPYVQSGVAAFYSSGVKFGF